ncbi:phosphatase PAP2 family protein [Nocardioides sp. GXQ0305]|uniref:phosphatase PAP2 family protein n=1 Tax=Nocardioides sp. GXQ0305 TaxID=3423912 RepID=UPI003D7E6806
MAAVALVRLERLVGLAAVGLAVAANATTWLLKATLPRPDLGVEEITPATLNSMPSGHSTAVFSAVAALLFVLPRRWRRPAALTGGAASVLVALATMSAGWHRAGDSMAGFFVVGFWSAFSAGVVVALEPPDRMVAVSATRVELQEMRWPAVAALAAGIVGLTFALSLDAMPSLQTTAAGAGAALVAAALLLGGAVVATLLGILVAFDLAGPRTGEARDRGSSAR